MAFITVCSSSGFLLIGYDNVSHLAALLEWILTTLEGIMGGLVNNAPFLETFSLDPMRDSNVIGTIVAIYVRARIDIL